MESECILHIVVVFAIFVTKIIKVSNALRQSYDKTILTVFFLRHSVLIYFSSKRIIDKPIEKLIRKW